MSTASFPRKPLIAILGATGTGKSRLAVHIAKHFNGEIINSDALQLYAGLTITTNKVPVEEQQGVPHHLLGCLPIYESSWTVGRFTAEAAQIIEGIRARGKVPIVVGGTGYYLQSLVFRGVLVADGATEAGATCNPETNEGESTNKTEETIQENGFRSASAEEKRWPILAAGPEAMLAELRRVDPIMAGRWHPNDARKIRRSLVIYYQMGRRASEIYAEQEAALARFSSSVNESAVAGENEIQNSSSEGMKYDTLFLWTHTEPTVLEARLEKRVSDMLDSGMLDEIKYMRSVRDAAAAAGEDADETRGIWVAIGYKEFGRYLDCLRHQEPQSQTGDKVEYKDLIRLRNYGEDRTIIATRQYAKRQIKWIRNKLLPTLSAIRAKDYLFVLDSTHASSFALEVEAKALDLASRFLNGKTLPSPRSTSDVAAAVLGAGEGSEGGKEDKQMRRCELCEVAVMTGTDWLGHLRSTKHRRAEKRRKQDARNPFKKVAYQGLDLIQTPAVQEDWPWGKKTEMEGEGESQSGDEFSGLGALLGEEADEQGSETGGNSLVRGAD